MTFEELKKANELIATINLKGKEYAEVNQRVKAFRFLFPEGTILTKMEHYDGETVIFSAMAYNGAEVLSKGTAWEKFGTSNVNRFSALENAETSAVGRCLGFLGLGIDTSIASAEEIQNAELNEPLEDKYITALKEKLKKHGVKATELKALKDIKALSELTIEVWQKAMDELEKKDNSKA